MTLRREFNWFVGTRKATLLIVELFVGRRTAAYNDRYVSACKDTSAKPEFVESTRPCFDNWTEFQSNGADVLEVRRKSRCGLASRSGGANTNGRNFSAETASRGPCVSRGKAFGGAVSD